MATSEKVGLLRLIDFFFPIDLGGSLALSEFSNAR